MAENAVTRALRYAGLGAGLVGATVVVLAFGAILSALAAAMIPLAVMASIFFAWRYRRQLAAQAPQARAKFSLFRRLFFPGGFSARGGRQRDPRDPFGR